MRLVAHVHHRLKARNSRGDTIIEVLLSVTILGLVLALSFTSAGRSLNSGTDAANRNQALSYAQEQIELLHDAANNGTISNYPTDTAFCIDPSDGSSKPATSSICQNISQSQFDVSVRYNAGNQTYNVSSDWQGAQDINHVILYYQVPFNPITTAPNVGITISASPAIISYNQSSTISWTTTTALSCKASGAWNGPQPINGSLKIDNIQFSSTYSLTCIGLDGTSTITRSTRVYVSPLPAPVINFSASPSSIARGASTTLNWTTTDATDCTAAGGPSNWNGDKGTRGTFNTGTLNSDTTYTLACNGVAGAPSSQTAVTVTTFDVAPTVKTLQATVYSSSNVYLSGQINPNGYASTAWYQWGNTSSFDACQRTSSTFAEPAVSYDITDTRQSAYWADGSSIKYSDCSTNLYWYRICAYNNYSPSNIVCGSAVEFGLLAPSVATGGVSHCGPRNSDCQTDSSDSSQWMMYGTVNPNGTDVTSCYIHWDNDPDGYRSGQEWTAASSTQGCYPTKLPITGTSTVTVENKTDIGNSNENNRKTIYYQQCAANSVGTSCGVMKSFRAGN